MSEEIFDAKDLPGSDTPGRPFDSVDRFQVMVRLARGQPVEVLGGPGNSAQARAALVSEETSVTDIATSLGGTLERRISTGNFSLSGNEGSIYVLSFPDTPARDNIISALSRRPGIEVAELDSTVHALLTSTDTHYANGVLWGMLGPSGDGIGAFSNPYGTAADVAWANAAVSADGKVGSMRTVVGLIDTGVDPLHPDLYLNIWINQNEIPSGLASDQDGDGIITFRDLNVKVSGNYVNSVTDINGNGRIDADDILRDVRWANSTDNDGNGFTDDLFGWDFRDNDNRPFEAYTGITVTTEPANSYHGTHVAGTIGALANSSGVVGVNWDVQIMPLRFIGPAGVGGNTSDAIEAIYYYTAMGLANPELNFVGTNNSWGGGSSSALLSSAIQAAGDNGHLFIAAAGNDSNNNNAIPSYPANYSVSSTYQGVTYDPVVSVASITSTGALSSFSNYGATTVDLAAPGSQIASTFAGDQYFDSGYTYLYLNGTSMATPHVTGAAALIASEFPGLHPADLRSAILGGVTTYSTLSGVVATGGTLNIPGSLSLVGPAPIVTINDALLTLADAAATVTFTFPEAVTGFTLADISVSTGHGSVSGLSTTNNTVWTATFTPGNVETQGAQIFVGNRFTSATGDFGRSGESAPFAIDRIAPSVTVSTIAATKDGAGANIDGTLSLALAPGDVLKIYRDGTPIGNASVTTTSWHFDDTSALPDGTHQYTARVLDAAANPGILSSQAALLIDTTPPTAMVTAIVATHDGAGANIDGTLSAALAPGETLSIFRDAVFLGSAFVTGTGWHYDDTTALSQGTYQYTARPVDASANQGTLSSPAALVVGPATDFSLTLGTLETGHYGLGFGGANDADGIVTASFTGTGQDLKLTLTGFDVDGPVETQVLLNGTSIGYFAQTPNNGTAPSQFTLLASDQLAGTNVITFANKSATWLWGLTDILLEPMASTDFSLTLGTLETGHYGNGFGGASDPDGVVTAGFQGTSQNLVLTLTGFDVDGPVETQVLLNGTSIGYFAQTPNNGTAPSQFTLLASDQLAGTNVITFANKNATWLWGLTDILLEPASFA